MGCGLPHPSPISPNFSWSLQRLLLFLKSYMLLLISRNSRFVSSPSRQPFLSVAYPPLFSYFPLRFSLLFLFPHSYLRSREPHGLTLVQVRPCDLAELPLALSVLVNLTNVEVRRLNFSTSVYIVLPCLSFELTWTQLL